MADKPILFSGPMVRALLAGTKTQTRRIINPQPKLAPHHEPVRVERRGERGWVWMVCTDRPSYQYATGDWKAPYAAGDRLYVRESHYLTDDGDYERVVYAADEDAVQEHLATIDALPAYFSADLIAKHKRLRPSIHMPRWASRITLTVTDVRVERLQDISPHDALAEGVSSTEHWRPKGVEGKPFEDKWWDDATFWTEYPPLAYRELWEAINGAGSWDVNPWIAAYTFTVHLGNIDQGGR